MHRSIGAAAMALLMVTSIVTVGFAGAVGASSHSADAQIAEQTSGGHTVVVDEVTVPDGGFVTIHDSSVNDGGEAVIKSVRGSSAHLEPGTHENVEVKLDEPLTEDDTLVAMPHKDTNDDQIYSFGSSGGADDGPYTSDGEAVVDTAEVTVSASVSATEQPSDGSSVLVDRVELSEGGFVTIHDSSLQDGATFDSVRGSTYLPAGVHEDVRVELDEPLEEEDTLIPMAHMDTNDNQEYDFVDSEGAEDGPFTTHEDGAVIDSATVTPTDRANVTMSAQPSSGHYVVVDEVFVPEGGFATIHDSTVLDGEVFGSIRGSSDYLEPGLHRDVGVHLDEPLEEDDTLVPMAHKDTDGDEEYRFAETEGEEDGPYADENGDPVVDTAETTLSASVSMDDTESDGNTVVVDQVDLSEGGFVTIHDASLNAGETLGSVRGSSEYLEAGHHHDVEVQLDEPVTESQTLIPMAHKDTNDNQEYDFVEDEGADDGPYVDSNEDIVLDTAHVSVLAQVTFTGQEDVDETVTIDRVTLHNGGFVTLHDSSVLDGDALGSVRGTSEYLGPGTHEDVVVEVDEVPGGEDTFVAMPHQDTNDNQEYDFVDNEGADDGPYTVAGEANVVPATVTAAPSASTSISDQTTDGTTVTVDSVSMNRGGFVTIHDGTLLDGEVIGSVRGTSEYLEPGEHSDVEITLDRPYEDDGTIIAMPHQDTNDNEQYDFVENEADDDGPYATGEGEPVLDDAALTVDDGAGDDGAGDDGSADDDGTVADDEDGTSDGDGAGFGAIVALLAILGSVFAARRMQ